MNKIFSYLCLVFIFGFAVTPEIKASNMIVAGVHENIQWTLDDNRVLTIGGEGEMPDYGMGLYTGKQEAPWKEYSGNISKVIIENGITSIGSYAFCDCLRLTNIEISESVTSIGDRAFAGCENLVEISMPDSITTIGEYTFQKCNNLSSVKLSNNLVEIGEGAFNKCNNLIEVYLPDSIIKVGYAAFLECEKLEKVNIPTNLTYIEKCMFEGCKKLKSVSIHDKVTRIGYKAFGFCESLTYIEIPNGVSIIEEDTFVSCEGLVNIKLPEYLYSIEEDAFYNCSSLKEIEIPDSVSYIGQEAFGRCTSLERVKLSNSIRDLSICLFRDCTNLMCVEIRGKTPMLSSIGIKAFKNCPYNMFFVVTGKDWYIESLLSEYGGVYSSFDEYCRCNGHTYDSGVCKWCGNICVNLLKQDLPYLGTGINMSWEKIISATGYEIYRSNSLNGNYEKIGDTNDTKYCENNVGAGLTYYYKVRAYKTVNSTNVYGDFSSAVAMSTKPATVSSLKQKKVYSANSIQLSWGQVTNATGYEIYRATSKNGNYVKVSTTTKPNLTNIKLKAGKTYYYKIRAYVYLNESNVYGDFSTVQAMITKCKSPAIKLKAGKRKVTISWKKVSGSNGYEVYMSSKKGGKYNKLKTLSAKKTTYTKKKLSKNKKYYFKVRAYRTVGGKKIYSTWSSVKSVKIK